jgi:Lon-like ATP-dependent protease
MVLPIARKPLFPHAPKSIIIKDPQVTAAIQKLVASGQPYIGAFLTRQDENDADTVTSLDEIYRIGVFAQILKTEVGDDASLAATILPHRRIRIKELSAPRAISTESTAKDLSNDTPEAVGEVTLAISSAATPSPSQLLDEFSVTTALVENLDNEPYSRKNPVVRAITSEILAVIKDIVRFNPAILDQITAFSYMVGVNMVEEPSMMADFAASLVPMAEPAELQSILESLVIEERLQKALILLKKELANLKLQHQINKDVEEKMANAQREYHLMQHMKGIQRELGLESDGREKLLEQFTAKAKELAMPKAVKTVFEEEMQKFKNLEAAAMEFNVTRNYLDWLTQLPWGKQSTDNFDIAHAQTVLEEDHYGMKDVKDRILEFIAVGKLKQSVQGKILCFVGPPGMPVGLLKSNVRRRQNVDWKVNCPRT